MKTPHYGKFRTNEYVQFFHDVHKICAENDPVVLKIETQVNNLNQTNIELSDVFKKDKGSGLTEKIVYYDHRRDEAIICLRKMADAYTNYFDDDYIESAKRLLKAIDKYGRQIYKLNYQAETSTLKNLINDLRTIDELIADIQKLTLTGVVDEMDTMNEKCNEFYLQRVQESAAEISATAGEIIKQGRSNYSSLVEHIEAHATLTPSAAYSSLINQLNVLIDKYNTTVDARGDID